VRALRLLGETEAEVYVRNDLADSDGGAVERRVLEDNLRRRNLDKVVQARAVVRLFELEQGRRWTEVRGRPAGELRARVGRVFGKTGRSVSRYVALLKAPRAVQDAHRRHRLTPVAAGWVAGLGRDAQAEVACRIEAGEDPREVVREARASRRRPPAPGAAFGRFARGLASAVDALGAAQEPVSAEQIRTHSPPPRQARERIDALLEEVEG
jgi:hypothetical protein